MTHESTPHCDFALLKSFALNHTLSTWGKESDGWPLFSLPLLSFLILLLSHKQPYPLLPFYISLVISLAPVYSFFGFFFVVASFVYLLSVCSLLIPLISFPGCLSASACMAADLPARRGCSYPPSSVPLLLHCPCNLLLFSLTLK